MLFRTSQEYEILLLFNRIRLTNIIHTSQKCNKLDIIHYNIVLYDFILDEHLLQSIYRPPCIPQKSFDIEINADAQELTKESLIVVFIIIKN